jgi:oxygen-independent coproporphyrinogen-3 oxidase
VRYDEELCNKYIDALIKEIHMVGSQQEGRKEVTSLYFGGGTPALAVDRIKEIIDAIKRNLEKYNR